MRAALLATCAALRCLAPAQEANSTHAFLDRCVTIQREVDEQRQSLNELFLASLAEGVESGAWTEDDRNIARDAYAEMLRPIQAEGLDPAEAERRSKAKHTPERRGLPPTPPMRATTAVESWFLTRHYHLDRLFDRITESHAAAAVEYAEELWLQAKKAADFAPAVRPLLDVRERGVRWPSFPQQRESMRPNSRSLMSMSPVSLRSLEAFDAWSIVASPDGLLPPDPEMAPESAFFEWELTWQALRRIQHQFLARPKIAARYAEVIERRAEAKRKAEEGLIDLVLKDAPLAELNSAATAIGRHYKQSPQPQRFSPPAPQYGQIRDYRSLTGPARPPVNDPSRSAPRWNLGPYLVWRKAVEEGSGQVRQMQEELMKNLASLPPDVSAHVQRQIARTTRPNPDDKAKESAPAETQKGASDLEVLIGEVQSAKQEMRNVLVASSLPELVHKLERGPRNELASEALDFNWSALAASSRGEKAFALREKIGRARIDELNLSEKADTADTPLIVVYRGALEKAMNSGQIDAAEVALAQSQLFSILPREEALEWARLIAALKTSNTSSSRRRESMRSIISNSNYPAIMRVAALQSKKS